jgi:hypothetical protein
MNETTLKYKDGRELLIEYDAGHISPFDEFNKKVITEMKDLNFVDDPIFYAVLQKYGVPNKNGRIYPEPILKREDKKYQIAIQKGLALNELNHPSCQCSDAQILTKEGWKYIKDISEFEEVFTINDKREIELQTIYEKKSFSYQGKMIRLKGRHIDVLVTPNHKFPVVNKNTNKITLITAQDIFDSFNTGNKLCNFYIPKDSLVDMSKNVNDDVFIISGLSESEFDVKAGEKIKTKYKEDLKIPLDVFSAFMGIYLSEGWVAQSNINKRKSKDENGNECFYESSDHGYCIGVAQKIPEKIELIDELMSKMPLNVKRYVDSYGTVNYIINDRRLYKFLKPLGKSYEKYIPTEVKNIKPYYLNILFKWFKLGDGRTIGKYKQSDVFSTSERLINDLQEILVKSGNSGNIRTEVRNNDRYITNHDGSKRLIKGKNTKNMWFLTISKTNGIWLDRRFLTVAEETFDDFVYSVDVPNHVYYTKTNEKCHWTGNSSLIDLDRISHSILETWWEGNVLMGKIKLFLSPGWKKYGIISCKGDQAAMILMNGGTLGISSRGVGSLTTVRGQNIVQDDFELICFDLVSSPSTPGAYVFRNPNDREKYDEQITPQREDDTDKMKSLMGRLDSFLGKN